MERFDLKIALVQTYIYWENKEKNLNFMEKVVKHYGDRGIDMFLFPEMSLTGYTMNMDKVKEIISDPAKLEATIKASWAKLDAKNEGEVEFGVFKAGLEAIAKEMQITEMLPTTEKGAAEFKNVVDPNNKGKVNFEGFQAIIKLGIENMKKAGKL